MMRLRRFFLYCAGLAWLMLMARAQNNMIPEHFNEAYCYTNDDLGAVYHPEATSVKLWAPTAKQVRLLLFNDATTESFQAIPMSRDPDGIWSADLKGDRDGRYYLYEVTLLSAGSVKPTVYRVNDPYARGCSANSGRTLIYDPRKTNPAGWNQDHFVTLKNNTDAVLYEAHIRDFSINKDSGVADNNRGKYLGMVQSGTKTPGGLASGLDHLKELGVTHVHLLPCFDYAGGDERQKVDEYTWYDWGYDPVLYNTPAGSYATNPDGTARQKEFKEMVQAFHRNHIGVVLDVVFNHTAATGSRPASIFDKVFPGYYYRMDQSGRYADGTGCGNELASEKPMVRKLIVDSIKYWMTEYHVDGFRFDLMGILDRETMLEVYREAKRINPDAIIYGEGWQMERVLPAEKMMTQANVQGTGIAAFNDGIRDNIKGDYANARDAGFVQGMEPPFGGMTRFHQEIKGQSTGRGSQDIGVFSPNETINYDSVHDDLCLWDKLRLSAPNAPEALRVNMDKLAAGIVLTAQGVPFLHAGDEFLRSKNLNPNSYNDNDPRVNPIDWSLKDRHKDVFNFYRGMIALRRAHPAFRMTDRARVDEAMEFATAVPADVVEYVLKNHANGDDWKTILVIYNGNAGPRDLNVTGDWSIVANDQTAGTETLVTVSNKIRVAPFSLVVAHTDGAYQLDANH
ncbi:MAG TPA: type I pullulanase [Candidatus Sulfopaludibacter sp.]|nr:type I pullulanase [Candidatus Sulfopaludibacter sp.]